MRTWLDALVDVVAAEAPALVSVSYGPFERWIAPLQAAGVVVATQVGTLEEALAAEQAGVDLLVARGGEGGGHGRADVATLPLLQGVLDAVQVPVVAAGGIGTARGLAAVLASGAAGAWVGTAFLACTEAATSAGARERLLAAGDTDTAYGRVFDVGQRLAWPPKYGGRTLRNGFFDRWVGREDELAGDDAAAAELMAARKQGDFGVACVYAGQGVALLRGERGLASGRQSAGARGGGGVPAAGPCRRAVQLSAGVGSRGRAGCCAPRAAAVIARLTAVRPGPVEVNVNAGELPTSDVTATASRSGTGRARRTGRRPAGPAGEGR